MKLIIPSKVGGFLDQLNNYQLLKTDSAPRIKKITWIAK
jgi:hypothetical protein